MAKRSVSISIDSDVYDMIPARNKSWYICEALASHMVRGMIEHEKEKEAVRGMIREELAKSRKK